MPRTKAFDPEDAVARALELFWERGYDGTSTEDLVDALGISRSSLYGTFGSKRALYERALERYRLVGVERVRSALDAPLPLTERLRRALLDIAEDDLLADRARGCFAANAALELAPVDPEVRRLVASVFAETRGVLRDELHRAQDGGELPDDADVEALATLLLNTLQGLRVLGKGTADRRLVEEAIDSTLALI
jgi:TetR/AcrR family transcriptional repressor of nem operon